MFTLSNHPFQPTPGCTSAPHGVLQVRFARVQPLDSSSRTPHVAADPGSGRGESIQPEALDRLEVPGTDPALPSAEAVWSPILALRTFVEPLTARASAAIRNFHVSFHEQDPRPPGCGEAAAAAAVATATVAESDETCARREDGCTSVVTAAAEGARAAPERRPGVNVEIAVFGHDRAVVLEEGESKIMDEIDDDLRCVEV